MLAIKVNDEYLDWAPGESLTLQAECPLFDRERLQRAWAFPGKLPATPRNLRALDFVNRLDTRKGRPRFAAELYLGGLLYDAGILEVTGSTDRVINFTFKNPSISLVEDLKAIRLRDLDIPVTVTDSYAPDIGIGTGWPFDLGGLTHFAFAINDTIFEWPIGTDISVVLADINAIFPGLASDPGTAGVRERHILFSGAAYDPDNFLITLQPDIGSGITHTYFDLLGTSLDDEITRIQSDWAAHLSSILASPQNHVFPTVRADSFYDERNPQYAGYLNYHDGAEYPQNPTTESTKQWAYPLVPMMFVKSVIEEIRDVTAITALAGSWYEDEEIQDLIVWNNRALDFTIGEHNYVVEQPANAFRNVWSPAYNLARHLPDLTAYDFLLYLVSTFCIFLRYEDNQLTLDACKDLLLAKAEDWTSKARPEYKQSYNFADNYTLDYERQGFESEYQDQLRRVDGGDDAQAFTSAWYTLFTANEADRLIENRKWRIPFTVEVGHSDELELDNLPTARLLFYRGLTDSYATGGQYPLAQHDAQDYPGASTGAYSLDWQGEKGLYEQWWKEYIDLLINGRQVTMTFRLTPAEIIELKRFRKIRKIIYTPYGQITAIVKSFRLKAGSRALSEVSITFITE